MTRIASHEGGQSQRTLAADAVILRKDDSLDDRESLSCSRPKIVGAFLARGAGNQLPCSVAQPKEGLTIFCL